MHFKSRKEAGRKLANSLLKYKGNKNAIILAIPRGGVEVGYEIANFLKIKLDVIITKKIGMPGDEEFAIGSVAPDKSYSINDRITSVYNISEKRIKELAREIGKEIERRYKAYKGSYSLPNLKDKIIILVDDGIATGFTTKAAIEFVRKQKPKKIILAVPVGPKDTILEMRKIVDDVVCPNASDNFFSISQFYEDFPQMEDIEIKKYLNTLTPQKFREYV